MGVKCCPKQKPQRTFFLLEALDKKARQVTISCQGSKNTCSQLWDSLDPFYSYKIWELGRYQHHASFCLRKEILKRGKTQTCFIPHYPLPPHTANFLPYHCAQQPEAARMQHKARLPCSKVLTALPQRFL